LHPAFKSGLSSLSELKIKRYLYTALVEDSNVHAQVWKVVHMFKICYNVTTGTSKNNIYQKNTFLLQKCEMLQSKKHSNVAAIFLPKMFILSNGDEISVSDYFS
jgi:hypothetical protein